LMNFSHRREPADYIVSITVIRGAVSTQRLFYYGDLSVFMAVHKSNGIGFRPNNDGVARMIIRSSNGA